jgi:hypothetical protein
MGGGDAMNKRRIKMGSASKSKSLSGWGKIGKAEHMLLPFIKWVTLTHLIFV